MDDDLNFKCGACGGANFIADNDPPLAEDMISCGDCGKTIGTLGAITKATASARTRAELEKLRAKAFGAKPN
ncbi:MAG: hypothetical protein H2045_00640 [Rhizobiales bacterium]|nr:hypothetical protein [Hyphomicrobiales bacterium]